MSPPASSSSATAETTPASIRPSRRTAWRRRDIRVFTLAVGSRQPVPDAAVETVNAPDWIYKDDTLRVSALVRLDNLAGKTVKIELLREQTVVQTQTIVPTSAQLAQELTFHDRPPEPGIFSYQIRIPPVPGEAVADNNASIFALR